MSGTDSGCGASSRHVLTAVTEVEFSVDSHQRVARRNQHVVLGTEAGSVGIRSTRRMGQGQSLARASYQRMLLCVCVSGLAYARACYARSSTERAYGATRMVLRRPHRMRSG
eukprot:341381-Rhodomonas_salina.2